MDREKVEQSINELLQMGHIIEIKGELRVIDEQRFYRHRRWKILDDLRNPED